MILIFVNCGFSNNGILFYKPIKLTQYTDIPLKIAKV